MCLSTPTISGAGYSLEAITTDSWCDSWCLLCVETVGADNSWPVSGNSLMVTRQGCVSTPCLTLEHSETCDYITAM